MHTHTRTHTHLSTRHTVKLKHCVRALLSTTARRCCYRRRRRRRRNRRTALRTKCIFSCFEEKKQPQMYFTPALRNSTFRSGGRPRNVARATALQTSRAFPKHECWIRVGWASMLQMTRSLVAGGQLCMSNHMGIVRSRRIAPLYAGGSIYAARPSCGHCFHLHNNNLLQQHKLNTHSLSRCSQIKSTQTTSDATGPPLSSERGGVATSS